MTAENLGLKIGTRFRYSGLDGDSDRSVVICGCSVLGLVAHHIEVDGWPSGRDLYEIPIERIPWLVANGIWTREAADG